MSAGHKPHSSRDIIRACVRHGTVMGPPKFFAAVEDLIEQLEAAQDRIRILERLRIEESNAVGLARISNPASEREEESIS